MYAWNNCGWLVDASPFAHKVLAEQKSKGEHGKPSMFRCSLDSKPQRGLSYIEVVGYSLKWKLSSHFEWVMIREWRCSECRRILIGVHQKRRQHQHRLVPWSLMWIEGNHDDLMIEHIPSAWEAVVVQALFALKPNAGYQAVSCWRGVQ